MVYDVVVIGAGLAGLTAATKLVEAGLNVLVLEARDRCGGRTYTVTDSGYTWDIGGQWIGANQPKVRKLIADLGLKLYPQFDDGKHILVVNGKKGLYSGNITTLNDSAFSELEKVIEKFEKQMNEVPLDNPTAAPKAQEYDGMTVETWEKENIKDPTSLEIFNFLIRTIFASEPSQISFLFSLFFFRSGGGYDTLSNIHGGAQQDKVEGGTQQISTLMAKKLGKRVHLNSEVREIVQDKSKVTVVCANGKKFKSKYLVVAVPPSVAGNIHYDPPMPGVRDQLTQRMPCGCVIKLLILYEENHWRKKGFSGEVLTTDKPLVLYYDATSPCGKFPALVGFVAGNGALEWSGKEEELKKATIEQLVGLFGEEMRNVKNILVKDWSLETFSRGCYVGVMPAGVLTSVGKALREPVGQIHWAGTETATNCIGYMEGAVDSGERVAEELLVRMKGESSKL